MDFKQEYKKFVKLMDKLGNLPSGATGDTMRDEYFEELKTILHDDLDYIYSQDNNVYMEEPYYLELLGKFSEFLAKYWSPSEY